jgi:hypothetical protein
MSESKHARRARFHQAWYRSEVLGISDWGSTPSGRPLGSILPPHAANAGKNFTSASSLGLFNERRRQGWGVDPVRMTNNMISSQTLLVNLLGPLIDDRPWFARVLACVLRRSDITEVLEAQIEFAPASRNKYLGDMTRVDAFVLIRGALGIESVVMELKYADRFSTRRLRIADNDRYAHLADTAGLWLAPERAFRDHTTSQLLRSHALGARTLQVDYGSALPCTLLLVNHPLDFDAGLVMDQYRAQLAEPKMAVQVGIDLLLSTIRSMGVSSSAFGSFQDVGLRYLEHERSEPLWIEHLRAPNQQLVGAGRQAQAR